ncbi:uncharacterized protein LOC132272474 [Cornus florida]|uniref:uncharacterized protein LOC132272474 n=1 Tax=Cornus florida TaxID=4283 RepID=UPI00289E335E|nr:uncharacterized protein LOC132272474 [Cornus florida]
MRKKHYTNACYLCLADWESLDHLFFKCKYSCAIWEFIQHVTSYYTKPNSWRELIDWCSYNWSRGKWLTHKLLLSAAIYFIWQERNTRAFRNKSSPPYLIIRMNIRARLASIQLKNGTDLSSISTVAELQELFAKGCLFANGQTLLLN